MKFGEKEPRSLGRWSDRVLRILPLPGKKHLMGLVEIEVVEQAEAPIERGARRLQVGRAGREQCGQTKGGGSNDPRSPSLKVSDFHAPSKRCIVPLSAT